MDSMLMPTMLTIKQTAAQSGLAEHFIRQLCWQNKIRYVKAGSKYLINLEKFIEFLNAGESESFTVLPPTVGIRELP